MVSGNLLFAAALAFAHLNPALAIGFDENNIFARRRFSLVLNFESSSCMHSSTKSP
jgi:hypothetical protein